MASTTSPTTFDVGNSIFRLEIILKQQAAMIFSTMDALSLDESKCASCGKEDDNGSLKRCNACKLVKYCNAECQKTHRPAHKKLCKKRAKELYDEKLFADPPPPDDCPICLLTMPLNANESVFKYCCGKLICGGCILTFSQKARQRGNTDIQNICPFCREPMRDRTSEEEVAMYNKFMERGDGYAFLNMGAAYLRGSLGLEKDIHKAVDLWIRLENMAVLMATKMWELLTIMAKLVSKPTGRRLRNIMN
jgi:hypothetical protein